MTSQPQSTLSPSAPPAYSEKQQLQQQQATAQQNQGYQQGPGFQAWPQGYPMLQAGVQMPLQTVVQPPNYPGPHDFFMLSLVTTIICGILNLVSLSFGIPAIVLAVLSMNAKKSKNYPQARKYGRNALILTIFNLMFTLCMALLMTGLIVGTQCATYRSGYRYYSYYRTPCG